MSAEREREREGEAKKICHSDGAFFNENVNQM